MNTEPSGDTTPNDTQPDRYAGYESNAPSFENEQPAKDPVTKAPETETQESDDGTERNEKHRLSGYKRQKANAELYKSEAEALRAELAQYKQAQSKPAESSAKADPDAEPNQNDYESVLDYLDAKSDWRSRQAVKSYADRLKEEQQTQLSEREYAAKTEVFNQKVEPLLAEHPDFYERASQLYESRLITQGDKVESAVLDAENPGEVTLYLLDNPQAIKILQGLPERQVGYAIARLEAQLKGQASEIVVRETKAAAPINPVRGGGPATRKDASDDNISFEDYKKVRGYNT